MTYYTEVRCFSIRKCYCPFYGVHNMLWNKNETLSLLWTIKVISFNVNYTSELLAVLFLITTQNLYPTVFKIMIKSYDLEVLPFSEQKNTSYFST